MHLFQRRYSLNKRLPFHHGDGELDAGNTVDPLDKAGIIIQRTINRLHDEMAVNAQNSRKKLGTEAVHHRHDDDEGRHAQHDAGERKPGNDRDKVSRRRARRYRHAIIRSKAENGPDFGAFWAAFA